MPTLIRSATANDLLKLKEIIDLSFPRFFRFFATHSLRSSGTILVGEMDGIVGGFVKLTEFDVGKDRFGCVLWLAVHPSFRCKGLAADLVYAGTIFLKGHGVRAVFASVQHSNVGSLSTFRKVGFGRIGFLGLWRVFGWRVFSFYVKIWFAPSELVLIYG